MIDWEQLERELADGEPDTPFAGSAAARRRERRRLLLVAAVAVLTLAALVVPLCVVVLRGAGDGRGSPAAAAAPRRPAVPDAATRAAIYAAALTGRAGAALRNPVIVRTATCPAAAAHGEPACAGAPIPPGVQRQLRHLLGPAVTFSAGASVPQGPGRSAVVQFGRLVVAGSRARLGVTTLCGSTCGEGETLALRRSSGRWRVVGTVGPRWVS